mmetsp:Transcript_11632/g.20683  ORF Transcript_11632/g.20683 Transcript_11632/m.20683 type:complete len:202 (+) Transcript_11632:199-804(+)
MPAFESSKKTFEARPRWLRMPEPMQVTIARFSSKMLSPSESRSARRAWIAGLGVDSWRVMVMLDTDVQTKSALTLCKANLSNTEARKLLESNIRLLWRLITGIPFLEHTAAIPWLFCPRSSLRSFTSASIIEVPPLSGLNVLRIWIGTLSSIAHSMVNGWSTSLPKYVSSLASSGVTMDKRRALSILVGLPVKTPSDSFQT